MSEVLKQLCELAKQNGVMIDVSVKPCIGSFFVHMEVSKEYEDETQFITSEFIIDDGVKDFGEIKRTFQQMLGDA